MPLVLALQKGLLIGEELLLGAALVPSSLVCCRLEFALFVLRAIFGLLPLLLDLAYAFLLPRGKLVRLLGRILVRCHLFLINQIWHTSVSNKQK